MARVVDVFLSHTWRPGDLEGSRRLRDTLRTMGLTVWFDEDHVRRHDGLSPSVQTALERSRVFVAWFSEDYATSGPCGWELSTAYLAARRLGTAVERIAVVNPSNGKGHIHPIDIRDALYSQVTEGTTAEIEAAASAIAERVRCAVGVFGDAGPTPEPAWFGPRRPSSPRFVGRRHELMRLQSALTSANYPMTSAYRGPNIAQLFGFGGSGKSLLAARYAEEFAGGFPGGIYWLAATRGAGVARTQEESAHEAFLQVAPHTLDLDALRTLPLDQLRQTIGRSLDAAQLRFLWIVDDLHRDASIEELSMWTAPGNNGATLVTSLRGRPWDIGTEDQHLRMDGLSAESALRLITFGKPAIDEHEVEEASQLARELGNHPLAVDVTRAALAARGGTQTYGAYLRELRNPTRDELEAAAELVSSQELPTSHVASIAATIMRSASGLSVLGAEVLRTFSVLGQAPVPQPLLTDTFLRTGLPKLQPALDASAAGLLDVEMRALASRDESTSSALWEVHALVRRLWLRNETEPATAEALRLAAIDSLVARFETAQTSAGRLEPDHPAVAHAHHLASDVDDQTHVLAGHLAMHEHRGGRYGTAISLQRRVGVVRRRALGQNDPATIDIENDLGAALLASGELLAAKTLLESVAGRRRQVQGAHSPQTLVAQSNLASALMAEGSVQEAVKLLEDAAGAAATALGADHHITLSTRHNLASALGAAGDRQAELLIEEELVASRERILGPKHPDTLTSRNNLASSHWALGRADLARPLFDEVLADREEILGEDHPDTLTTAGNLAASLSSLGRYADAEALERSVLASKRRLLGPAHPDTLTSACNLAGTLHATGALEEARSLLQEAVAGRERTLGSAHFETSNAKNSLAAVMHSLGDLRGAAAVYEQTTVALTNAVGAEHPMTLAARANLGNALRALGHLDDARKMLEFVSRAMAGVLGHEHPHTLTVLSNLALAHWESGDRPGAIARQRAVTDGLLRAVGLGHALSRSAQQRLAEWEARR